MKRAPRIDNLGWTLVATLVVIAAMVTALGMTTLVCRFSRVGARRHALRWRVAFEPGFYRWHLANGPPERPFEIIDAPAHPSRRIVTYSLYGNHPKYIRHMQSNLEAIRDKLPGWRARIYLHDRAPREWRDVLERDGVDLFVVRDDHIVPGNSAGAFWRFMPLCEPGVDCVVLDADDRLTSGRVRDIQKFFAHPGGAVVQHRNNHPWPVEAICAADLFKKGSLRLPFDGEQLRRYPHRSTFGSDEAFLLAEVAPYLPHQGVERRWGLHHMFVQSAVYLPPLLS